MGYDASLGNQFVSINGATATTASGTFTNSGGDFSIGFDTSGGLAKYNGVIDEVGFWTRALSQPEIQSLYNSGAGITYPFNIASRNTVTTHNSTAG